MLSSEFEHFIANWLDKAAKYSELSTENCYDKFFTLFIVFNRLYAEATFELARRKKITLPPNRPLPDKKGATEYTLEIIGLDTFKSLYTERLAHNVMEIAALIENERFFIKLGAPDGIRQPEKDQALLADLRSSGRKQALAILDVIYTVRCNLFHGHKAFHPIQTELLQPVIAILISLIEALHMALN